jgi:hypothetical protein
MRFLGIAVTMVAAACLCAPAAATAADGAEVSTFVTTENVTLEFFVPCANGGAGETVSVTGTERMIGTAVFLPSGALLTGRLHVIFTTFSGVGLTTGTPYHLSFIEQSSFIFGPTNDLSTTIMRWKLVGEGPAGDLTVRQHLQFSFDLATHEIVVHSDQSTFDCS